MCRKGRQMREQFHRSIIPHFGRGRRKVRQEDDFPQFCPHLFMEQQGSARIKGE